MEFFSRHPRLGPLAIVLFVWAGIYLSGIGVMEINYNESRRIFPALTMSETGDWFVPVMEGKEYFKKPPLINWMIASSFILSGHQDEFAARLPSALLLLFFAVLLSLSEASWLGREERLCGALIFLTTTGIISKGYVCEIEAGYISLTGMAMLCWLDFFHSEPDGWKLWTVPGILVGISMLLKGPASLFFYYAMVISVLAVFGMKRRLFSFKHLAGVAAMLLVFGAWAAVAFCRKHGGGDEISGTWASELMLQFEPGRIKFGRWLGRVAGSLANFAPWIIFLPFFLWWKRLVPPGRKQDIFRACAISFLITFAAINLMPGTKARYTMPLMPLACAMLAMFLPGLERNEMLKKVWRGILLVLLAVLAAASTFISLVAAMARLFPSLAAGLYCGKALEKVASGIQSMPAAGIILLAMLAAAAVLSARNIASARASFDSILSLVLLSAFCAVLGMLHFPLLSPVIRQFDKERPLGAKVAANIPAGKSLILYRVGCQPFVFYVPHRKIEVYTAALPEGERPAYILLREELEGKMLAANGLRREQVERLVEFAYEDCPYVLCELK